MQYKDDNGKFTLKILDYPLGSPTLDTWEVPDDTAFVTPTWLCPAFHFPSAHQGLYKEFSLLIKMVGYKPEEVHLTSKEYAAVGAVCGFITRVLCQPLDVVKIRFQLQIEPIRKTLLRSQPSKYHGVIQAFQTIVKEEGVTALWKGHIPAQVLSVTYGVAQFASFEILTKLTWRYLPEDLTTKYRPLTHTVCGGLAGCIAITAAQPADILRTRFVSQGNNKVYKSLYSAVRTMAKEEGLLSFYKGLGPALAQIGPQMGLQFGFYSLFTKMWEQWFRRTGLQKPGIAESVVCGSAAGMISKTLIYPLDIIKKRLEVQGFEKARADFGAVRQYRGLRHCFVTIAKEERGLRGLFKGLSPSLLKAALASSSNFLIYDQLCYLVRVYHSS